MDRSIDRKTFLKISGAAGVAGAGILGGCSPASNRGGASGASRENPFPVTHEQSFNMRGYAAPPIEEVGVAVIGVGNRGSGTVRRLASIEGVQVRAISDMEEDRVNAAIESISATHSPDGYFGGEEEWKKVCERDDIHLVAIATPWEWHVPMALHAMESGKHAYTELPAAQTVEDCWRLVETSERTRMHCVQMSASCHSGISAVVLNMARQGVFGELIHAEGAYIHDLMRDYNFTKTMYHDLWRLKENIGRHGSLYPQHGLVPILQIMDMNCGDQLDYLVSMSSNDFMMNEYARELASEDPFWEPYVDRDYRGNMNTTTIRTKKGRTIVVQHDVTSPRPGVRFDLLSGTNGVYQARPPRFAHGHDGWVPDEEFQEMVQSYTPEITKRFRELSESSTTERPTHSYARVSPTDWRLIDSLRMGLPMDMDVYDAALSSSVIPLSEWSVANRSTSVDVPDFTMGAWESNPRGMDINLEQGGGETGLV
ncbi:MAG: Gfo/Idh/MocA family oxidoreductase [Balneolaceae bacterium]